MTQHIKLGYRLSDGRACGFLHLPLEARRQHVLVTGKSGTGKSTLLKQIFSQEANAGRGALLIDPHGDLAREALDLIHAQRIRKTIYINPTDEQFPIGFNVLEGVPPDNRAAVAADIVEAFRSIWGHISWGPQLAQILYHCVRTLLEVPGTTLLGIRQLLKNKTYRKKILDQINDPDVTQFWRQDFPDLLQKDAPFASVLNKIDPLLSAPLVRNMLGQPRSGFHPRHLIDNNYLVVVNLSRGDSLGADHARFLGMFLLSAFASAGMSRSTIPEHERKDFAIIIDEFQTYTTQSISSMLAEARKYRLSLTLAHQYLGQLGDEIREAVLGNVGTLVTFTVGAKDAERFSLEHTDTPPAVLTELPRFQAKAKIQRQSGAYSYDLATRADLKQHGQAAKIIAHSRIHYASSRLDVEARINRFLEPGQYQNSSTHRHKRHARSAGPRPPRSKASWWHH